MATGTDRRQELRKLYIQEGKDLLFIADKLSYPSPKAVADDLKELNIPLRTNDEAKTTHQFNKQFNSENKLVGYHYTNKTVVLYSEKIDVRNYKIAQIFFDITKYGNPANTQLDIAFEVSFKNLNSSWFTLKNSAIASLSIADSVLPAKYGYSIDNLGGDFFRIKLSVSGAGSLDSSNYFIINNLIGSFFGT